jgi:hypothetical protein
MRPCSASATRVGGIDCVALNAVVVPSVPPERTVCIVLTREQIARYERDPSSRHSMDVRNCTSIATNAIGPSEYICHTSRRTFLHVSSSYYF